MKLSMQIIHDQLIEFHPTANIRSNLFEIEAVRLFAPDTSFQKNTLYVGRMKDLFVTDSDRIMCTHENDIILLETDDLESVLNCILNALALYSGWENEMLRLVSSGGMLQDLMDASRTMIRHPCMILDQSQRLLAFHKDFEHADVDEMWNQIIREGSNSMETLIRINRHDLHRTEKTGLYHYNDEGVFPNNSWHYNFLPNRNFVGTATIICQNGTFSQGELDQFYLLCQYIENWFLVHLQDRQYILLDNLLTHCIRDMDADATELQRMLLLMDWKQEDVLVMYKLDASNPPYNINRYLCNSLNASLQGVYAITYDLSICLLCNLSICSRRELEEQLVPLLKSSHYYATIGQTFTLADSLYDQYQYISIISGYVDHTAGSMHTGKEHMLDYYLEKMQQMCLPGMLHPAVPQLADYDARHNTEFSETLYCYIRNGRRFADTAEELHLHRNTLKYRLKRLQEIADLDLEQASERLHLWLSFEIAKKGERG